MDSAALVIERIDGGRQLIEELILLGFDVAAACWIKTGEESRWRLNVVSKVVDEKGLVAAYQATHPAFQHMPDLWDWVSKLKLIGTATPLGKDLLSIYDRPLSQFPVHLQRRTFGDQFAYEAYFYPLVPSELGQPNSSPLIHFSSSAELLEHVQKRSDKIVKAVIPLSSMPPCAEARQAVASPPRLGMTLHMLDGSKELLAKEDAELLLNDGLLSRKKIKIELWR